MLQLYVRQLYQSKTLRDTGASSHRNQSGPNDKTLN